MTPTYRRLSERAFDVAVKACHPETALKRELELPSSGRLIVLAVGKAAAEMTAVVEAAWDGPMEEVVVVRRGAPAPQLQTPPIEAAHPVPDEMSVLGARKLLSAATAAEEQDEIIVLLSGGASALACLPGEGLSLSQKQQLTERLLASGATIEEINIVRRHLSLFKGGRLAAAAYPASLMTYAISDVVGDSAEAIGSGATVADPTTIKEAKAILQHYGIEVPEHGWSESIKPGDPRLEKSRYQIIASAALAIDAVSDFVRAQGYEPVLLGADLEGEARQLGREHGMLARQYAREGRKCALLSGGELTVTVKGAGKGGPNFEYLTALALQIEGVDGIHAFAADTDGIDGNSGCAGGFVRGDTISSAARLNMDAAQFLEANDTYPLFSALGDQFAPGPTGTNVNDLRIIWIG